MAWVKWESIISSYGAGGLNIGSLRGKNWALLGKWWWRFRVEGDVLWGRVIRSIYGRDGGFGSVRTMIEGSGVWSGILRVGVDLDNLGIDFTSSFERKVGNGMDTSFWEDRWRGNVRFRDRFPRLFHLDSRK